MSWVLLSMLVYDIGRIGVILQGKMNTNRKKIVKSVIKIVFTSFLHSYMNPILIKVSSSWLRQ